MFPQVLFANQDVKTQFLAYFSALAEGIFTKLGRNVYFISLYLVLEQKGENLGLAKVIQGKLYFNIAVNRENQFLPKITDFPSKYLIEILGGTNCDLR